MQISRMRLAPARGALMALLLAAAFTAGGCRPTVTPLEAAEGCRVGIIGDSLTVGSMPYFAGAFAERGCGVSFVNAAKSRSTAHGALVAELIVASGQAPDIWVIALGTNDGPNPAAFTGQVDRIVDLASGRPVLWVNIDRPRDEQILNGVLAGAEVRRENLWVYDWNGFVEAHPQLRARDRVHLTGGGYALRAALIAREVAGL
jgi:lysophospholipase L1-like esterase